MPPKGKKGGKKGGKKDEKAALPEIDKAFYELEIADLNRKLARLRAENLELKESTGDLASTIKSMEEDRSDVVEFLKRVAEQKSQEADEIKERILALGREKKEQAEKYEKELEQLRYEYRMMHEQLTAEIKLLNGKLNSLEEFRIMRDEIMKKFENQEDQMEKREQEHARQIYEMERKFVQSKDRLKKEMEARLMQLSTDFHDAAEMCIADTTRRVIRENISINNELNLMMETQRKMYAENVECVQRDKIHKYEQELNEEEKSKLFRRQNMNNKIIKKLSVKQDLLTEKLEDYKVKEKECFEAREVLKDTNRKFEMLETKLSVTVQNVHMLQTERSRLIQLLDQQRYENGRLLDIIRNSTMAVKASIKLGEVEVEDAMTVNTRKSLLDNLLKLLKRGKDPNQGRVGSRDTLDSLNEIYNTGDLGLLARSSMELLGPRISEQLGKPSISDEIVIIPKTRGMKTIDKGSEISTPSSEEGEGISVESVHSQDFAADIESVEPSVSEEEVGSESGTEVVEGDKKVDAKGTMTEDIEAVHAVHDEVEDEYDEEEEGEGESEVEEGEEFPDDF